MHDIAVSAAACYWDGWAARWLPVGGGAHSGGHGGQVTHETDARHLRDPAFQVRALRYRTGKLLFTVAQRLRKHTGRLGAFHGVPPTFAYEINSLKEVQRFCAKSLCVPSAKQACIFAAPACTGVFFPLTLLGLRISAPVSALQCV